MSNGVVWIIGIIGIACATYTTFYLGYNSGYYAGKIKCLDDVINSLRSE